MLKNLSDFLRPFSPSTLLFYILYIGTKTKLSLQLCSDGGKRPSCLVQRAIQQLLCD